MRYKIKTAAALIGLRRSRPREQCGNCRLPSVELFTMHGKIQMGKREVEVSLDICLTCFDYWQQFVQQGRLDGFGTRSRDWNWYPEK